MEEIDQIKKNMGVLMSNPKQRNSYIIVIALALILIVGGLVVAKTNQKKDVSGESSVAPIPKVDQIPGDSDNFEYNKSVKKANEDGAKKALEEDTTFTPSIVNDIKKIEDEKEETEKEQEKTKPVELEKEEIKIIEEPIVKEEKPIINEIKPIVVNKTNYDAYSDYKIISVIMGVNKNKNSNSEFNYAKKEEQKQSAQQNNNGGIQSTETKVEASSIPYSKAGTIYNAILETGINSDEPSPVLAKIISGELKNSRLIGSQQTVGEKVVVQFSVLNMMNKNSSVKINAFAVDPNTSRTSLADDVDNHYFLKYGVLLASSFLSGYADAISRQNTTTTINPSGGTTVSQGELPSSDIIKQAVGNVGKSLSNEAQKNSQEIKPTITVNSGSAIGVLLMEDLFVK